MSHRRIRRVAKRGRTSARYLTGSTFASLQKPSTVYATAAPLAPASLPAKRKFFP